MTSRELVYKTLEFENTKWRAPRDMWTPTWTELEFPRELERIRRTFPLDFAYAPAIYRRPLPGVGSPTVVGESTDEWNCEFHCAIPGVFGQIRRAIVTDEEWEDADNARIPRELLSFDADAVNSFCAGTDKFVFAGYTVRVFERLQFIRGIEETFVDLALKTQGMFDYLRKMHAFYCELLEKWAATDVDALLVFDDWGGQKSLLTSPQMWREYFKPLYKDYADIARAHGKKIFMHTDGYVLDLIPEYIDIGADVMNLQLFCMGPEKLAPFKGKLTFWGEICRQQIIPNGTKSEVDAAVDLVYNNLWNDGGCIAHCEFGPLANPDNVFEIYRRWNERTENRQ